MRLDIVSNGLGSQSMWLLVMAAKGEIPARVSITADTGSELDRLWSTGERSTAREYFYRVVLPYAERHGIDARFVRAEDVKKQPLAPIIAMIRAAAGEMVNLGVPLYTASGGQLRQTCTDKWKIRAIRQEARRMGATHLRTAQGIHYGEADRRVKGKYLGAENGWSIYQDTIRRDGKEIDVKWCSHYYPLVDKRLYRPQVVELLKGEGIPYLISSECDMCPHQDLARWERHTPESLAETAELEASFGGQFFFTDERIPLMQALARKRERKDAQPEIDFGCENGYCGI